ncbi:MAG: tetratricopeptide repeat protein [Balneola sp.]
MYFLKLVSLYLVSIFVVTSFNVNARQEVQVDSLMIELNAAVSADEKFFFLEELYYHWLNNNYDSADVYAGKYHQLAIDEGNKKNESIGLNYKGIVYDYRKDVEAASELYNQALEIRKELGDERLIGNSLSNLGALYFHNGDYTKASDYYFRSLDIREKIQDSVGLSQSYNNLGILFRNQNEYEKALEYYSKSAELKQEIGRRYSAMYTLLNIGSLYIFMEEYENAVSVSEEALLIAEEYQDKVSIASLKLNIGSAKSSLKNYSEARILLKQGIEALEEMNEYSSAFEGYTMLITTYLEENDISEALKYVNEVKTRQEFFKEPARIQEFYNIASRVYMEAGDYKQALQMKLDEAIIKDSLFNVSSKNELLELETKYQLSEKDRELFALNAENDIRELEISRSNLVRNFSLFLALVLIGVTIYGRRNAQVRNQLNKKLTTSLAEKELLMKEVHHRVKNNLQIISSLLNIQSRRTEHESAAVALQESKNRVQSMALIHQSLYQKDNITNVKVKEYIEQLLDTLMNSFGVEEKVTLKTDIQNLELEVDLIIPLGLIINELVTNVIKYAFDEEGGDLIVTLNEFKDILRLEVADNGKGINSSELRNQSFGMSMVESLSKKLKADLVISSETGTSIQLDIKDYKRVS